MRSTRGKSNQPRRLRMSLLACALLPMFASPIVGCARAAHPDMNAVDEAPTLGPFCAKGA
jgi:hypothetical protein